LLPSSVARYKIIRWMYVSVVFQNVEEVLLGAQNLIMRKLRDRFG